MSFWNWNNIPPPGTNIDMSHPMARDLGFFFNGHEALMGARDLVTGRCAEFLKERTVASTHRFRTAHGYQADFASDETDNANGFEWPDVEGDGSGRWSPTVEGVAVACRVHPADLVVNGGGRIITKADVANNTDNFCIMRGNANQNEIEFRARDDAGTGVTVTIGRAAGNYDNVGPVDAAMRCDTTNATGFDAYVYLPGLNEYYEDVANTSPTTLGDSINGPRIGAGGSGRARMFDGYIDYACYWIVPKSLAFLRAFQENPWQIFEQPSLVQSVAALLSPQSPLPGPSPESPLGIFSTAGAYLITANPAKLKNNAFLYSINHAIEMIEAGTFPFDGNTFTELWNTTPSSPDGNQTTEAALLNEVGPVTLNITDGDTPTVYDGGNIVSPEAQTTLNNNISVTLTNLRPGTEVRVYPSQDFNSPNDLTELAGIESTASPSEFTFSAPAGTIVDIVVFNRDYVLPPANRIRNFIVPTTTTSFPVSQIIDRNYSNP
jgi:hypothetical protein